MKKVFSSTFFFCGDDSRREDIKVLTYGLDVDKNSMTTMMQSWENFASTFTAEWNLIDMNFPVAFLFSHFTSTLASTCSMDIGYYTTNMFVCRPSHIHNDYKMLIICWFFIFCIYYVVCAVWRWRRRGSFNENIFLRTTRSQKHVWKFSFEAEKPQIIIFCQTEQICSKYSTKCKSSPIIVSHSQYNFLYWYLRALW